MKARWDCRALFGTCLLLPLDSACLTSYVFTCSSLLRCNARRERPETEARGCEDMPPLEAVAAVDEDEDEMPPLERPFKGGGGALGAGLLRGSFRPLPPVIKPPLLTSATLGFITG